MTQDTKVSHENPYALGTVVNNLPEELNAKLSKAFEMQREYVNETDCRIAFIGDAIDAHLKYKARAQVNAWEAIISKCQKLHKEFNREQAIDFLRKTRTGKEMEELAAVAAAVLQELS